MKPVSKHSAHLTRDRQAGTPLLKQRPFRMLTLSRFNSRVAQNALNFGLLLIVVDQTGRAVFSSLLVLALVLPSTFVGLVAGAAADILPRRLLIVAGNGARALVCLGFVLSAENTTDCYLAAVGLAAASQFAVAAEGSMTPLLVSRTELPRANAIIQGTAGGAQLLGMGILTPVVLRLFHSPEILFGIAGALFAAAAVQASLIGEVRSPGQREIGGDPEGAWWAVGWRQMRGDPVVMHAAMELTLISTALIIMGGLIPKYISDTLSLRIDVGVVVLLPAAVGVIGGLRVASFLAHRIPHALLSTGGFVSFVVLLMMLAFVNTESGFLSGYGMFGWLGDISIGSFNGGGVLAMMLMFPLGFSFALVAVAGQTLLNDRVPLYLQGRVVATQGAMAAIAASVPVVVAGAMSDVVGVTPVIALVAGGIGMAAALNLRQPREPEPVAGGLAR